MKAVIFSAFALATLFVFSTLVFADIKYIKGHTRSDGTYVSGHYRDTSNDGKEYNNANNLGYNRY